MPYLPYLNLSRLVEIAEKKIFWFIFFLKMLKSVK